MAQQLSQNGLPTRRLGKTDEQVSILCLGGAHLGRVGLKDEPEALRLFHAAVDNGVRFFRQSTCHHAPEVYSGIGESEAASLLRSFFADRR